MSARAKCALCPKTTQLRESHVIPAFAGRLIRRTSAAGRFQTPDSPERTFHDIFKLPLLCDKCEQRFSRHESRFAQVIFHPFIGNNQLVFNYDDWLLQFALSLAWRVARIEYEACRNSHPDVLPQLRAAMNRWADFLLGNRPDPGTGDSYAFIGLPLTDDTVAREPLMQWYLERSVDGSIIVRPADNELHVFSKLAQILFWTCISPPSQRAWRNSQISARGTLQAGRPLPITLQRFLRARWEDARIDLLRRGGMR